jgi:hypothetical protein
MWGTTGLGVNIGRDWSKMDATIVSHPLKDVQASDRELSVDDTGFVFWQKWAFEHNDRRSNINRISSRHPQHDSHFSVPQSFSFLLAKTAVTYAASLALPSLQ